MKTRWSGFSACTAVSGGARAFSSYLVASRNTSPWGLAERTRGASWPPTGGALGSRRATGREPRVLRHRDVAEAVHDAPHRAEQPDEGGVGTDRGEEAQPLLDRLHLARDRHTHHLLDALAKGGTRRGTGSQALGHRAAPFAHRRGEDARHRIIGLGADAVIEILQRHTGPEG